MPVFESYFEEIYQQKSRSDGSNLIKMFCQLNQVDSDREVGGEIMFSEVRKAIRKLNYNSAPGADGLTSDFYHVFIRAKPCFMSRLQQFYHQSMSATKSMYLNH